MGKQLGPGASGDPDNPERRVAEPTYDVQPTPTAPVEPEPKPSPGSGYPRHRGGGWYELSDGRVIRGEDEAEMAEADLRDGGGMSRAELNAHLGIDEEEL